MLITKFSQMFKIDILVRSILTLGLLSGLTIPASAQITYEGGKAAAQPTPGNFNIPVSEGKQTGGNLFHSFGTFGVPTNGSANFEANSPIPVQNIFGRVTGGAPSLVDGKLQVIGNANLFLMNPAGIVFGKGASLDINGAFTATTAKAIDFDKGKWFNAMGDNKYAELTGNPIGLAFPGSTPGSIFSAATLANVQPGKSITLVGGTVISTGDIKTAGGNISIATVEGGKYVQIKSDGSILRLDLPASATNIALQAKAFTALSLPQLLTNPGVDLAANGVKNENGVVTLVGDPIKIAADIQLGDTVSKQNRPISSGDIITRSLNASSIGDKGGNIYIDSRQAILTSEVNTSSNQITTSSIVSDSGRGDGGSVEIKAQTIIKTDGINSTARIVGQQSQSPSIRARGGNVELASKEGDVIVDWIQAQVLGSQFSDYESFVGGNLLVRSAGLFRAIKPSKVGMDSDANISINTAPLGAIDIQYRGSSFITGVTFSKNSPGPSSFITVTPKPGFTFPNGVSGSRGAVSSSIQTNGSVGVVYTDGGFVSIDGGNRTLDKFSIKGIADRKDPSNPDQQASKPKSKENCTPSSTSVASNPTAAPTRSAGNPNAVSADPCQPNTSNNGILQILTDRE